MTHSSSGVSWVHIPGTYSLGLGLKSPFQPQYPHVLGRWKARSTGLPNGASPSLSWRSTACGGYLTLADKIQLDKPLLRGSFIQGLCTNGLESLCAVSADRA